MFNGVGNLPQILRRLRWILLKELGLMCRAKIGFESLEVVKKKLGFLVVVLVDDQTRHSYHNTPKNRYF